MLILYITVSSDSRVIRNIGIIKININILSEDSILMRTV